MINNANFMEYVEWGENVGEESRRTYTTKLYDGFWNRYCQGTGLDIGYTGYLANIHPILPQAVGIDTNYPGYKGVILPFENNSQNYVYSSHCLEHITDDVGALKEWHRVTRVGGYIIITVPHRDLYEKKLDLPSNYNADHKRFYTSASLLTSIEKSFIINSYRVRHLRENDAGHDYNQPTTEHSLGQYEIECVIEKIK